MLDVDQKLCPTSAGLLQYLDTWGPVGQRAKAVLQDVGLLSTTPRTDWQKSRLTPTGAPLEFGFAQSGDGLRYTVEVYAPSTNPSRRMNEICAFLQNRGLCLPARNLLYQVARMQAKGVLTYGAWLGVRHCETGDRFKIYAELPQDSAPAIDAWGSSA